LSLLIFTLLPEHRSAPVSRSDSGPRPCTRTDADRLRGTSVVSTPDRVSAATRSAAAPASWAPRLRTSDVKTGSVNPVCSARSRSASAPGVSPAGGVTSTARRGSQPTCTVSSGRISTGIAGSSV
jgi:hypothetical protein